MHVPKLYLSEPYSYKIRDIDIRPTWRCNARCPTCGSWKRENNDLNFKQTSQIIKYFHNLRKVIIEGGEPTLWDHLIYFIKHIDAGDKALITNAINTERIKEIASYFTPSDMRFVVSLNGLGDVHDFSRGVKGAFDSLVRSVDVMYHYGYDIRFQFIAVKRTIGDLEKTRQFIKARWGVDLLLVSYPSKIGIYGENIKCEYLNDDEMRTLLMSQKEEKKLNKIIQDIYTKKVNIAANGGIYVCQYADVMKFGQVYDDKIEIDQDVRKNYCKMVSNCKYQYSTGQLCSHEAAVLSLRHNLLYLMREAWKQLI